MLLHVIPKLIAFFSYDQTEIGIILIVQTSLHFVYVNSKHPKLIIKILAAFPRGTLFAAESTPHCLSVYFMPVFARWAVICLCHQYLHLFLYSK